MKVNIFSSRINRNFKSDNVLETKQEALSQQMQNDAILYEFASYGPKHSAMKSYKRAMTTFFVGAPFADSVMRGIMQEGPLSTKMAKYGKSLGGWAGIIATATGIFGIKKVVNSNFEKLDNFDKKHPFLSFGVDVLALGCTYSALTGYGTQIVKAVKKVLPKTFLTSLNDFKTKTVDMLNNSKLNTKLVTKFDNLMANKPALKSVGNTMALLVAPAIIIATAIKLNKSINKEKQQADENFVFLKSIDTAMKNINTENEV